MLQNSKENTCARPQVSNFIKKESLTQAFSYEFCKIFRNNFFTEHIQSTASEFCTEFFEEIYKKRDLEKWTVCIDSLLSWFNDFEVFLLYLEIVLYL